MPRLALEAVEAARECDAARLRHHAGEVGHLELRPHEIDFGGRYARRSPEQDGDDGRAQMEFMRMQIHAPVCRKSPADRAGALKASRQRQPSGRRIRWRLRPASVVRAVLFRRALPPLRNRDRHDRELNV